MTVHNLSSTTFNTSDINLLSKGLTFSPTPQYTNTDLLQFLPNHYDNYANAIRQIINSPKHPYSTNQKDPETTCPQTTTSFIHRKMKFLTNQDTEQYQIPFTNVVPVEGYIENTKVKVKDNLAAIFKPTKTPNLNLQERRSITDIKRRRDDIIIKPADKNLGIVILDRPTYIEQCLVHLSSTSYNLAQQFPSFLLQNLQNLVISFRTEIHTFCPPLYRFLATPPPKHRPPRFYGLPKIHKLSDTIKVPPLRPIVSHTNSILSRSAQFLDHVLQPLARTYPDYLHNSTDLINILSTFHVSRDVTLVSMDVVKLYPSIPQEECINTVAREIQAHQHLLIIDPNFIIQLLAYNMRNNFFEFANQTFHQTTGIAMGAAFSPTVANIYMSILLKNFLHTTNQKPLLLKRYIDDIFLIWPPENQDFTTFVESLNSYHPNIKFTATSSSTSINFLDLTIYKGQLLTINDLLDIKTFQKENNLYQYLYFSSNHPKSTFKSIIIGECTRYVRTNTEETNYHHQVQLLSSRLQQRKYPVNFINKYTQMVNYSNRTTLLQPHTKPPITIFRPIFRCPPPPQFKQLKQLILEDYYMVKKYMNKPIFITLKHRNLLNIFVKAKHSPTPSETSLILQKCTSTTNILPTSPHPKSKPLITPTPRKCGQKKCATCQHFNTKQYFRSTVTKRCFRVKGNYSCNSTNIIYLITCKKCMKQYVGLTTKTLRERINHHRSTIIRKMKRYISSHFSLLDHNINDLTVQIIDSTHPNSLAQTEQFWINTLKTTQPLGLNCIDYYTHQPQQ